MGNRVEDLERQVAELQATVDGLTEELVETKERLRQLEDDGGSTSGFESGSDDSGASRGDDHAEFVANGDRSTEVEPDETPQQESAEPADAGSETEDDGDESGDDGDIIVA